MGNLTDLCTILKVDPAYLGAQLQRIGVEIKRDGTVDINRVLAMLARADGGLNPIEVIPPRPNGSAASEVPQEKRPAKKEVKRPDKRKRIGKFVGLERVLRLLKENSVECVWEHLRPDTHPYLLLGNGKRAYVSIRQVTRVGADYMQVQTPTDPWDLYLLLFVREDLSGSSLLVFKREEVEPKKMTCSPEGLMRFNITFSEQFLLTNRLNLLR